jgi:hypothetical protein
MNFPRVLRGIAILFLWAAASFAADDSAKPQVAQDPPILPAQFEGWQRQGSGQISKSANAADPTNAAVLQEYGFTDEASATYTRDDGRTLKIRAARFADASGAFGAYTFYLQPTMRREDIGDQGASQGQRVLFYRGYILVDAQFSEESTMSGGQLRELAGELPRPLGNAVNLPGFLQYLPHTGYVANSEKYAMGPVALNALEVPVSNDLVDFNSSAEVVLGKYSTSNGQGTLMLISYPTPQLAAEHLRRIDAAHKLPQPQTGISSVESSGPFFDKRSGPLVAIASGSLSESDAKTLLGMVNYEAKVTWNENTSFQQKRDVNILLSILILCGILCAIAVVAGIAFGGIRVLVKRMFPDKFYDRPGQIEFISLNLTEVVVEGPDGKVLRVKETEEIIEREG